MPVHARHVELGTRVPWFKVTPFHTEPGGETEFTPRSAFDPMRGQWRPLLVMFLCNHSPYVQHILPGLISLINERNSDLSVIAISPNDPQAYPVDDEKILIKQSEMFPFSYAIDADQSLARAFEASCTPEFFLYGEMERGGRLAYHGEFDHTRPFVGQLANGEKLRAAIDAVVARKTYGPNQEPSFGCSIKWRSAQDATVALVLN